MEKHIPGGRVYEAVKELAPEIRTLGDTIEAQQKAPPELVEKLKEAGIFRMLLPRSRQGEELHPVQVSRIIETLARADGSTGWIGMISAGFNILLGYFSKEAADVILAAGPDALARGGFAPKGAAGAISCFAIFAERKKTSARTSKPPDA